MTDEVAEAVALLKQKRAAHQEQIGRIDAALAALAGVGTGKAQTATEPTSEPDTTPRTAREKTVALLDEADMEWSATAIVNEWARRGSPIEGKDPLSAVRAALKVARTKGQIVKASTGRYKSAKYGSRTIFLGADSVPSWVESGLKEVATS